METNSVHRAGREKLAIKGAKEIRDQKKEDLPSSLINEIQRRSHSLLIHRTRVLSCVETS